MNLTSSDYIRRLKLSTSALKLRDENVKIIYVAFEFGYGSVDGYQRTFFKEFGINPKEYALNPVPICLFTPYGIKYKSFKRERRSMKNVKNVFIQVVERPGRKVIIKRGYEAKDYFTYCEEVSCDVWGILKSINSISGEPFEEENYGEAIEEAWEATKKYDLKNIGYSNDYENPRIQLEPIGIRGYIEPIPIK